MCAPLRFCTSIKDPYKCPPEPSSLNVVFVMCRCESESESKRYRKYQNVDRERCAGSERDSRYKAS